MNTKTLATNTEKQEPKEYKNHPPLALQDYELLEEIRNTHDTTQESLFNAVICSLLENVSFDEWAALLAGAIIHALKQHAFEPTPIIAEIIDQLEDAADSVENAVVRRDADYVALLDMVNQLQDEDLRVQLCAALGL